MCLFVIYWEWFISIGSKGMVVDRKWLTGFEVRRQRLFFNE